MRYGYSNFVDQSKEGIISETNNGLIKIGVYMYLTMGFPIELFIQKINELNVLERLSFYLYFKNYVRP